MNKEKFLSLYPKNKTAAAICYDALQDALMEQGICTQMTMIGALATVRAEVGFKFKPIEEHASGEAYEGRKSLGNTQPGDGKRFKGRGYIQLTGRANYTNYGKRLGLDLVKNPQLALDVRNSARILAVYFKDRKVNLACNRQDWVKVRKLVNGGTNGLDVFLSTIKTFI